VDPWAVAVVLLSAIGCGTAVVLTFIDKAFGGKQKSAVIEAKAAEERARMLEARLIDSHRQNDLLQKQLDWHTKMLETQDRLMNKLADSSPADRTGERTLTASRS
jgi:hypothetical protein